MYLKYLDGVDTQDGVTMNVNHQRLIDRKVFLLNVLSSYTHT